MPPRWLIALLLGLAAVKVHAQQDYNLGVGIADVTGPSAEVTFIGYARLEQKGSGIHLRQFSRAFIFDDGENRVVFVSVGVGMISYGIRKEVLERLSRLFGADVYTEQNVILSATHTHSGPGGYNQYLLYDISVLGFVKQTFDAIVTGIVKSVERAHANIVRGRLSWSRGILLDANINRSPTAYLQNPQSERDQYLYNVDKEMIQLKLERTSGEAIGVINWFAVHPTSMNNSNTLVSSDNVGYASVLFEQKMNKNEIQGKGKFVAAFASTNLGDVSPNLKGPRCSDTGETCDLQSSTCEGANVLCIASGPGKDMFQSTKIIAKRLFSKAFELFEGESEKISGSIRSIHQYVDMSTKKKTIFQQESHTNLTLRGCLPAMGYSFAAGTTDGPGAFTFIQGMTTPNDLWNAVRDFLVTPSASQAECQGVKPILIPSGEMKFPFEWQPRVVSTGIASLGSFTLVSVPGEFSTMAGRRIRRAVREGLNFMQGSGSSSNNSWSFSWMTSVMEQGQTTVNISNSSSSSSSENLSSSQVTGNGEQTLVGDNSKGNPVVICGLSNTYSSYIVTKEEYKLQRYEAASTIFGPNTLALYQEQYRELAAAMVMNVRLKPGQPPRDLKDDLVSLVPPVIFDSTPWNKNYGDCTKQPPALAIAGDTVSATFISGHPRNNLRLEGSYLSVERKDVSSGGNVSWTLIATDANWETKYIWHRTSFLLGTSESRVEWTVPDGTPTGTYRLRHEGYAKYFFGGMFPYSGTSRTFKVMSTRDEETTEATSSSKRRFFNWF